MGACAGELSNLTEDEEAGIRSQEMGSVGCCGRIEIVWLDKL